MFHKIIEVLNRAGCDRLEFELQGQALVITAHRDNPPGSADYIVAAEEMRFTALNDDEFSAMILDQLIAKFP